MLPHCGKVKDHAAPRQEGKIRCVGWLDWLKGPSASEEGATSASGAVRRIAAELAAMPENQARYLAAVAR